MITLTSPTYESPTEAAIRMGWPLARIRKLIRNREVRHVKVGSLYFLPYGALEEYIEANTVEPHAEPPNRY